MSNASKRPSGRRIGTIAIAIVVAVIGLVLLTASWKTIPPGYVGIAFNKANNNVTTTIEPGWTLINPFTTAIQEYPFTLQTYIMVQSGDEGRTGGDDSVKVQSSEAQQLNLDIAVQYRVKKEEAAALYTDWGGQDLDVIELQVVRQQSRSILTTIAGLYTWESISGDKRAELADKVKEQLIIEFERRHLILEDFVIREVHLPDNLKQALENKITAQQAAERQKYELEQAQIKAEQDKVEAQGRAEAQRATAKGDADSILIRAEAQADANRLLAESVTDALIRYQMALRWDGKLPVFSGEGATPLVDVSELVNPTQTITP
ncbi:MULTISPECIES: prohibitin family protein [Herpetosiphon]|uniref:prohibitin family protein n=1 Tax=Herpetosiphon TaxID=64 RepID=UPI0013DF6FA5|nr:prohibitin family protein [Herpetosiphon llansteffanensis]